MATFSNIARRGMIAIAEPNSDIIPLKSMMSPLAVELVSLKEKGGG